MISRSAIERRMLVVAPTGTDALNTLAILQRAGFTAEAFGNAALAANEVQLGCAVLVLAEEALRPPHHFTLQKVLASQAEWSNLPMVVITSTGTSKTGPSVRSELNGKAYVTLLERPLRSATLIAAVEAAQSSREQQYAIRDLLAEREKLLNSLEERVQERTAKLQALVEEMEAFSYSVSHDLRAPLRVLAGFAQALQEDYSDNLPPEGHRLLLKIANAAQRMDVLTQDLLAYTRIASGHVALEVVDLDEVLDSVIETYPTLLEAKKSIHIQRPLGKCMGHVPSLSQCFSNLLDNAVKFTRANITPEIKVFSKTHGKKCRIHVVDHGIGVDPKHEQRIFGLFERAHSTAPGTGIGLAIVKKAAERMYGKVGLNSTHPGQTEFWIELAQGT